MASASSLGAKLGDLAVTARTLLPRVSCATADRKVLSTPPEYATIKERISDRMLMSNASFAPSSFDREDTDCVLRDSRCLSATSDFRY